MQTPPLTLKEKVRRGSGVVVAHVNTLILLSRRSESPRCQGSPALCPPVSRGPWTAPGLSWSLAGASPSPLSPRLSRPSSHKHPDRREASGGLQSFPRESVSLAPESRRAFQAGSPRAWQFRAVSPPHFPAHIAAESRRNWEWLSAKSCRRTANPVLEGGTGS